MFKMIRMLMIVSGLRHFAQHNLIHKSLMAENIMLMQTEDGYKIKLIDKSIGEWTGQSFVSQGSDFIRRKKWHAPV